MTVYVSKFGEGLIVLLGVNFMYAAGMRRKDVLEVDSAGETDDLLERAEDDDTPECSDLPHFQDGLDESDEIEDCPSQAMPEKTLYKLEQEYVRRMWVSLEDLDLEPAGYIQEGSELMSQLRDEIAMLPELNDLSPECDIAKADVGEPGHTTPNEDRKCVVCVLDVGDAKRISQRPRSIAPHLMQKVYELLKQLLETKLIENSESPWASPIVIVLKKNGVDIRMCIYYRVVNGFIMMSNYPLHLIDDLLIGFETARWFMSLDMVRGFRADTMTERAKLISAFVCPFGHFQWVRMPFGLKNAPLIDEAVINNCLWGFVRLPPEKEKPADPDLLEFLGLEINERWESDREKSGSKVPVLSDVVTVSQRNFPAPPQMGPVLGRSSYIDDIAHGAPTWDQLCADLDALLFRSVPKDFEQRLIIAMGVRKLPFPKTLKGGQSFLGSLNYYHKFIEDYPVVAVLYELTDTQVRAGRDLPRANEAFESLIRKIVSTPLLRHPDRTKPYVTIPHANKWAACAVLGQEFDGVIQSVKFTGRVQTGSEVRYHIAEKEVVAIMIVLEVLQTIVENCHIMVYTGYSVLSWLMESKSANGRCMRWVLTDGNPRISHNDKFLDVTFRHELHSFDKAMVRDVIHRDIFQDEILCAHSMPTSISALITGGALTHPLVGMSASTASSRCSRVVIPAPRIDARPSSSLWTFRQQVQGLFSCSQPNLLRRLAEALRVKFKSVKLVHVKRDYNQAANYLTSKPLVLGESWQVEDAEQLIHLEQNPPDEVTLNDDRPGSESAPLPMAARVMAAVVTRSRAQKEDDQRGPMGPLEYQVGRWRRIKTHQESDLRSKNLIKFLN
ncbi:unnamed protein product [Phytophthora fragariaefolia]|uniref:Unnamed protein product n=1 Tax=Phytophthora fragariaefolia TaxID=1490495 RepID=A0A9W6Y126_9STRA|nr:unnamed protein product [Phytophthora fragariaefolia]